MPRKRLPERYKISGYRFCELYYHALQYGEWEKELRSAGISPQRSEDLQRRIARIDMTCFEANEELAPYIKLGVTNKDVTYTVLKMIYDIPCNRNTYYKYRRKFYWLLDKKK